MKAYNKPEFYMTEFQLNDAVAAGCNSDPTGIQEFATEPQTITCLVSNEDTIFTTGISGCDHPIDQSGGGNQLTYESGDTWFFLDHQKDSGLNCCNPDDTDNNCNNRGSNAPYGLYYFWQGASLGGGNNRSKLQHLLSLVGIGSDMINQSEGLVWHGGIATDALKQVYTNSF